MAKKNGITRFVGTWELDLTKSRFAVEPKPKKATLVVKKELGGLALKLDWLDSQSKPGLLEHGLTFDEPVMVNGYAHTLTEADDGALLTVVEKDGGVVARTRRVLSADGKSMEYTQTGVLPDKREYTNTSVYARVR